jgi:hypothetical protein
MGESGLAFAVRSPLPPELTCRSLCALERLGMGLAFTFRSAAIKYYQTARNHPNRLRSCGVIQDEVAGVGGIVPASACKDRSVLGRSPAGSPSATVNIGEVLR